MLSLPLETVQQQMVQQVLSAEYVMHDTALLERKKICQSCLICDNVWLYQALAHSFGAEQEPAQSAAKAASSSCIYTLSMYEPPSNSKA